MLCMHEPRNNLSNPMPIMELLKFISKEEFWLPENVTWKEVRDEWNNPNPYHLIYCFPVAIAVVIFRLIIQRVFFTPIGIKFGFTRFKIQHCDVLEKAFASGKSLEIHIQELAADVNWSKAEINRWFHRRHKVEKISTKISESGWRATFYTLLFIYGLISLWDKPWFKNTSESWTNCSTFIVPNDIRNYYLIQLGFYVSLMISQFFDIRRKDFWQMFVHHIATILLISFSWLINGVRMGSLTLFYHDAGDIPMELAKLFSYLKMKRCCDVTFVAFLITWVVSRLIIYPFVILKSVFYDGHQLMGPVVFCMLFGLLNLLMLLHLMWTWMLVRVIKTFFTGNQKDVRSDSEDSNEDEKKTT